jgi:hypothetical protein
MTLVMGTPCNLTFLYIWFTFKYWVKGI